MNSRASKRPGHPITMPGALGDLARALGGVPALSAALRTPIRTLRGWAHGTPIPGTAQILIEQLCAQHGVDFPAETK